MNLNHPKETEPLQANLPDRAISALRALLLLTFVSAVAYYVAFSIHWPMLLDSPIMHYVRFLMDHGMRPYREITDNNMPGAYLTEGWAMSVFGGGDLGWRLYDLTLLASLVLSMVVIVWPVDWLAGIYAGGLFILLHASGGPFYSGEREELMTVLLMASCALLFSSVRHRLPWLMLLAGLFSAIAASVKPTMAPLTLILVFAPAGVLPRRRLPFASYLAWGCLGLAITLGLNIAFLLRYDAVKPFLFVLRTITPAYISMNRLSFGFLLSRLFPLNLLIPIPFIAVILYLRRSLASERLVMSWERLILLIAALFGAFSYLLQQKGFFHHRYMFVAFALLLMALELIPATKSRGLPRIAAAAGIVLSLALSIPHYLGLLRKSTTHHDLVPTLEADLTALGGQRLQGEVQCFDLIFGCLNALYQLRLVENTGYTGDLLLFVKQPNIATDYYRQMFWRLDAVHPASVYVVTNNWFGEPSSFSRINNWPRFDEYLKRNFTLFQTRTFPLENRSAPDPSSTDEPYTYRIYIRNGNPLLKTATTCTSEPPHPGETCGPI